MICRSREGEVMPSAGISAAVKQRNLRSGCTYFFIQTRRSFVVKAGKRNSERSKKPLDIYVIFVILIIVTITIIINSDSII
jgi:hypothetical protein